MTPRPSRPSFSGYGISTEAEGMLPWGWAEERLVAARNYWIATASPERGPHSTPVWGLWRDEGLVFSFGERSRKARNLAADPRALVHLESGDEVVIVEGDVTDFDVTEEIAAAYSEKYAPFEAEVGRWSIARPRRAFAWTEKSYPRDATRFDF